MRFCFNLFIKTQILKHRNSPEYCKIMQLKLKFALLSFSNVLDENNISGGKKKNPKS